jgi:hypothetical protein
MRGPDTHTTPVNPSFQAALDYLDRRWSVLPLLPPNAKDARAGKRPLCEWKRYQAQLPREEEIKDWWKRWPDANVGVVLGHVSALVGIDIDGPEGEAKLQELSQGDLPPTLEFTTGKGRRLLYRLPPELPARIRPFKANDREAVRILAEGAQTVMPPSKHPSGREYAWADGRGPGQIEPAETPTWLQYVLDPEENGQGVGTATEAVRGEARGNSLDNYTRACHYLRKCDPAISGQGGHNQTFKIACKLIKGFGLHVETTLQLLLTEYNPRCVPPWSEQDLRHKVEDAAKQEGEVGFMLNNGNGPTRHANGYQTADVAEELPVAPPPLPESPGWPEPVDPAAKHGLAGAIADCLEPHTESDPMALLGQFLVALGNAIGRKAHFVVDGKMHFCNEFLLLVGPTASARKGASWSRVAALMEAVDPGWAEKRVRGGLCSGEGLVWAIRDPITGVVEQRTGRGRKSYEQATTDPGVADKRLLAIEEKFAQVLVHAGRQGCTLSTHIRQAWDSVRMEGLPKSKPAAVARPHVSIIAHCTPTDLHEHLSRTDCLNGFGNRFLFACVKRSKKLAHGGDQNPPGLERLLEELRAALDFARATGQLRRDTEADRLWEHHYDPLTEERPGLAGALVARAAPHVMRLACIYALLDQSRVLRVPHLRAALAFWDYCERSVRFVFGDALGDSVADVIEEGLKDVWPHGLTREEINNKLFHRNTRGWKIKSALRQLQTLGRAYCRKEKRQPGPGALAEVWRWGTDPDAGTKQTK